MKRHLIAFLVLLLAAISAHAQSTTVSGTITDAGAQAWDNGTYSFVFKPSPSNPTAQYYWNGAPFSSSQTIAGNLDGSAHFSASVPSNTSITPSGSTWVMTLCSAATATNGCYTVGKTITGATQAITDTPPAIVVNLQTVPTGATAYTDSEIINALTGSGYWNLSDNTTHMCSGFPPCTWLSIGGSSASLLPLNNTWTGTNLFTNITTFSAAANLNAGGNLSGTFTGNPTFSGNVKSSGTLAAKNFEGVRYADQFASLQAAINDCAACEVYIPAGTNLPTAPAAQLTLTHTVWIHGAGMGQTIIQPTGALAAALFSITAANVSVKFSDLTIDMANAPAQTALAFNGVKQPVLENVQILYPPTTGTGTAVSMVATAEMHATNLLMRGAGICVDENGNASGEDFFHSIVCESPGTYGYHRTQTTSSDVGGEYLFDFKVTNPDNRTTAQGFVVTSTAANTGSPFFCYRCIGDNMQGGHTYQIHNMVNVFLEGCWSTNGASSGSNFGALNIDTATNVFVRGGYYASFSRDVVFTGTDVTIELTNVLFAGTNTNLYAAGATVTNIQLFNPVFSAATPMSAADLSMVVNNTNTAMNANGWHVGVSGSQGPGPTLSICNKDVGEPTPCVYMRTASGGGGDSFQILNNSAAQIFAINQAGTVATLGTSQPMSLTVASGSQALGTGAISAGACATTITVASANVLDTDSLMIGTNGAPSGGYPNLTWSNSYVTTGNVNFVVCNPSASPVTPAAETVIWRVMR